MTHIQLYRPLSMCNKWDKRFIALAQVVAEWSKDPDRQVGAVIADQDNRIMGLGYNGPPKGSEIWGEDKETVIHAEVNAIMHATRTSNCTIYVWPFMPCAYCASLIVQAGIKRLVTPYTSLEAKWKPNSALAVLSESNVRIDICTP
jgi:dCMP deaminase